MRIVRRDFNALRASARITGGEFDFGTVVRSSRTGLSGTRQWVAREEEIMPGFRHDAIPFSYPVGSFVVFEGHGSDPFNPLIVQPILDEKADAPEAPLEGFASPGCRQITMPAPWWAWVGTAEVPACQYDDALAWTIWRYWCSTSQEFPGVFSWSKGEVCPRRHGVDIDVPEVRRCLASSNGVKAPFFTVPGTDFIAMPPRSDRDVGMLIDVSGNATDIIDNWDEEIASLVRQGGKLEVAA